MEVNFQSHAERIICMFILWQDSVNIHTYINKSKFSLPVHYSIQTYKCYLNDKSNMTNCYQLIILLVAAITCSTALPATFPKGIDKASEESRDWLQRGIRNIFRFSPAYGGEEAVEQNWRRILSTISKSGKNKNKVMRHLCNLIPCLQKGVRGQEKIS